MIKMMASLLVVVSAFSAQAFNGCIYQDNKAVVEVALEQNAVVLTAKQAIGFLDLAEALALVDYIDRPAIESNLGTLIDAAEGSNLSADGSFGVDDSVRVELAGNSSNVVFNHAGGTDAANGLTAAFYHEIVNILSNEAIPGLNRNGACK